jgi:hypothetical protein
MTQPPITAHTDIVFAEHDGTQLLGDLYLPQGVAKREDIDQRARRAPWPRAAGSTTTSWI